MTTAHPYERFMLTAIEYAQNAQWHTLPNPAVGAVLVKDGVVVAQGWHKGAGLPHAEVEVLHDARSKGINPAECTLVVTLEPCAHHGKTPPCTDAILAAGIRHVVIGALDPNTTAAGGAELLREHGITVETKIAEQKCLDLIDDFVIWQTTPYHYTILKLASTMDGRIASRTGHSKWITAEDTRHEVHALRGRAQAVLVGGNTFYHDDPRLTCRAQDGCIEDAGQPLAVVATSRLPEATGSYHLLRERPESTIFWTTVAAAASPKAEALRRLGVRVIGLSSQAQNAPRGYGMRAELNLEEGLTYLRKELNCLYTLCEGGGRLGLSLLDKGFARELHLHLAPKILGDNEATPLFDGKAPITMDEALQLRITEARPCATDIILVLRPTAHPAAVQLSARKKD